MSEKREDHSEHARHMAAAAADGALTDSTIAEVMADCEAFEAAMVEAGYSRPDIGRHPGMYRYQRDQDRFVGWKLARAQPADMADAYVGAREDLAIWKKRALEAEDLNRKFMREINGPTHMGEPVIATAPAPADRQGVALSDEEILAVRDAIKYCDGWDGDQWDLALARAILSRASSSRAEVEKDAARYRRLREVGVWLDPNKYAKAGRVLDTAADRLAAAEAPSAGENDA